MPLNFIFRQPKNELEKGGRTPVAATSDDMELAKQCPNCGKHIPLSELWDHHNACECGYHFRMSARQRIGFICDPGTYVPMYEDMRSHDIINFRGYEKKLANMETSSHENEAVLCGTAKIGGHLCALFVMESYFMMGSMGTVVGEKITRLFEHATAHNLPVVGYTVSGGARMQEGTLSLMQMAKTSGAVKRHSDAGNFYLTVLTDPTTGGVTASFAMEGDIILAEPGATVGFAGARVIEQTVRRKLPQGFQKSEFLLDHGFVDAIVFRKDQRRVISALLAIHEKGAAEE